MIRGDLAVIGALRCLDCARSAIIGSTRRREPKATVVPDEFHVMQHAGAALDEVRRHEFFRAGPVMGPFGRVSAATRTMNVRALQLLHVHCCLSQSATSPQRS